MASGNPIEVGIERADPFQFVHPNHGSMYGVPSTKRQVSIEESKGSILYLAIYPQHLWKYCWLLSYLTERWHIGRSRKWMALVVLSCSSFIVELSTPAS